MVHGEKERRGAEFNGAWGKREERRGGGGGGVRGSEFNGAWGKREGGGGGVELPDSLMYEAVLQSAGFN